MRSHPKKRLGQHFLKDPNTARIVAEGVSKEDTVLEVGPGRGFLTRHLAERASFVHAIEMDVDVMDALGEATRDFGNVAVHIGDAARFDYDSLSPRPNRMAANLPYNVASPLVLRILEECPYIGSLRFMVQFEVARRMAAARGTKDYGGYAILIQLLAEPKVVHKVPPTVFEPPPRVYSAVVDMKRRDAKLAPGEYEGVKELVLAAFSSRRKRLANNLPGAMKAKVSDALASLGFGENARAEELSPEDFVGLYRRLS
ncbi:MAG: 16S rRNA (adenine(1518)-N(6)/adenine(1519)-N(6))-dimethyltransferase RsmA [Actinomycetota bacterium]|jgi:16S rRNA (adenine1518-N6/adenine1519-N6)-dimethyltransferase|nr:ribosomal RNA small subunit methyltransferase A [Rubrobacter sp.]MDQ3508250.1 16S rRNA (adenine(1518)-N(6)/adenine(1519)-N(6))-dimethyltransferase RsmA [Actinomycetota bacterium]